MKNSSSLKVGVVGATGVVGQTFLRLMEEKKTPVKELRLFASSKSEGQIICFQGKEHELQILFPSCFEGLDIVFFSSGDEISQRWAPEAVKSGAFAIDNSFAFRLNPQHKLVVPEVNGDLLLGGRPEIIANPNCSTIQLVLALNPLKKFGLQKVIVSSYQAVSGAGREALKELSEQTAQQIEEPVVGKAPVRPSIFSREIAFNCIPEIGSFRDEGTSSEEFKIVNETAKILGLPKLCVSAFAVRVPVMNAHSEAVWVTLKEEVCLSEIEKALSAQVGLQVSLKAKNFLTAREVSGQDDVFVGRLHIDPKDPCTLKMWIVGDNLRKGAALNGLQIAERIFDI